MSDDPFKSALREAAAKDAPPFSPLLHERIMARVRAAEPAPRFRTPSPFRRFAPLAAAASLILCAAVYLSLRPSAPKPVPVAVNIPSPKEITEPVDSLLTAAAAPARESLSDGKYGYLDHDAQRLMFFLADQFPTTPTTPSPPADPAPRRQPQNP